VRKLLVCPTCKRQYDASSLPVGFKFRCRCGATITVPTIAPHDASVIRCASCGAPKEDGASTCSHCGSTFTLRDQDLDTICPGCFARIENDARFCHHCGIPIVPETITTDPTDRICPACGAGHLLRNRSLGTTGFSALECPSCSGMWLDGDVFEHLEEQARAAADPVTDPAKIRAERQSRLQRAQPPGPFYRPCAVCGTPMIRVNFERVSGIVLDQCKGHGIWFDATELDEALQWIRSGGERLLAAREADEEKLREAKEKFSPLPKDAAGLRDMEYDAGQSMHQYGALGWILTQLMRR
jgi:Zn-finger nucleic acid-binding protein